MAHVESPGPCATPTPFFVCAFPPFVVCVVVTPFEFVCAAAAFPVFEFTATALLASCAVPLPFLVVAVPLLLVWVVVTPFEFF